MLREYHYHHIIAGDTKVVLLSFQEYYHRLIVREYSK